MKDKFKMSQEEILFWAKRNIIDYIWKSANLEGISATYPDTESIFEGLAPEGFAVKDILAINNLKRAWYFISEHLGVEVNYVLVCHINSIIGGTDWVPNIPEEEQVKEQLKRIQREYSTITEQAIELMLYLMRSQLFNDGNKRTAMMVANLLTMTHGVGIISIPINHQNEFRKKLVDYYETGNNSELKQFIYDHCIDGVSL